jgi:hypothetical protein
MIIRLREGYFARSTNAVFQEYETNLFPVGSIDAVHPVIVGIGDCTFGVGSFVPRT